MSAFPAQTLAVHPIKVGVGMETPTCGSRICVGGGGGRGKQDFSDIALRSRGGGKILGLKIGGAGGGPPRSAPGNSDIYMKMLENCLAKVLK